MSSLLSPEYVTKLLGGLGGGPSSYGLSYYRKLIECPKKVRLNDEYNQLKNEEDDEPEELVQLGGKHKLKMATVGIHGHQLFEQRWNQKLGVNIAMDARQSIWTPELAEAVRLYNNFNSEWGSLEGYLGMNIGEPERRMGESPEIMARVTADLGGPLTGRLDAAGTLFDVERCMANTGHFLLPGRWIVDYKFGKAHKKGDPLEFPNSLQGAAYCYLDELETPENPANGVLFVRIIGHKEMTREASYRVYVCPKRPTDRDRLRALIQMGQLLKEKFHDGNPLSCVSSTWGDECFFKKQQICPGF